MERDNAEFMARILDDVWKSTSKDAWFQIRSWLHGAYIVEQNPTVASDLITLRDIAKAHEEETKRV